MSSTRKPACANQPILVATANGVAAALTVRAHQPTRTTASACTGVTPRNATKAALIVLEQNLTELLLVCCAGDPAGECIYGTPPFLCAAATASAFCDGSQNSTRRRTPLTMPLST